MKAKLTIILLFFVCVCFGQSDVQQFQSDFDGDGTIEELTVHYYLGKIDFAVLKYNGGLKTCTLQVAVKTDKYSLLNTVPLCDDLLLPEYRGITQYVDSIIFQVPAQKTLDPTLGWLLDVYSSTTELDSHPHFSRMAKFKPKIKRTYHEMPTSHRLLVKGKLVQRINQLHLKADTTKKSWIIFDAEPLSKAKQISSYKLNPEFPELADTLGSIKIYKTGHSVFLETDTAHQVIFVSDGVLNLNMQKKEWESIQQIGTYKNYVLILTHPYPAIENRLYMVDTKKGGVYEIKGDLIKDYEYYYRYIESFEVMEDELYLFLKMTPSDKLIEEKRLYLLPLVKSIEKME